MPAALGNVSPQLPLTACQSFDDMPRLKAIGKENKKAHIPKLLEKNWLF